MAGAGAYGNFYLKKRPRDEVRPALLYDCRVAGREHSPASSSSSRPPLLLPTLIWQARPALLYDWRGLDGADNLEAYLVCKSM